MGYQFRFGTAGIRAPVGPGEAALNAGSVHAIACSIAEALRAEAPAEGAVCVAFDGRADSEAFADIVCGALVSRGFRVHAFERGTPTPLLAHAVRAKRAEAGVMVTASHNPVSDNGLKLYVAGGRQVSAPLDAEIERLIPGPHAALDPEVLPRARREGRLCTLGAADVDAYLSDVLSLAPLTRDLPLPKLAYSALCGVGGEVTQELFARIEARDVAVVPEQQAPRADFGGLASPNPEVPEALAALRGLALRTQAACAFAHDPDADRLAVLCVDEELGLRALTGDEVGALLGDFLLSLEARHERLLLVSSLVSGGLLERIAAAYGARYLRTRTGFKSIAEDGHALAEREGRELLFGYEEALGYAFFRMADDKDGIAALNVMIALVRRLHAQGKTLATRLRELSEQHGVFVAHPVSVRAKHPDDAALWMARLRALPPEELLGAGASLRDYTQEARPFPLLVFEDPHETRVCVRPSGTEPKLKLYLHAREDAVPDVATARARAMQRLLQVESALRPLLAPA